MYDNKEEAKKTRNGQIKKDEKLDLSLERAVETLKQQASGYRLAGLTHISSLLD